MSINFDIHCHPSLKISLFNRSMYNRHPTTPVWDPFQMQVDFPKMADGNVKAIMSAIYIPERGLLDYCTTLRDIYPVLRFTWPELDKKIERSRYPEEPFDQTKVVMRLLEQQVERAQAKGIDVAVVRSNAELNARLSAGRTSVLHTVEGAHSLGRGLPKRDDYIRNLHILFKMGVCSLTLGHFFPNDLVAPVDGFPGGMGKLIGNTYKPNLSLGLTALGKDVVRRMIEIGMVIDLTHCTPQGRADVFALNNNRRPVIISHSGVAGLYNSPMNPSDAEIRQIAACNGVIGIILVNFWLSGRDDVLLGYRPGLDHVIATISHIQRITGTYDNIAIGSDFDGFTDPSDDLQDISKFPAIRHKLALAGIAAPDVEKIMHGNIRRVLRNGWGA